MIFTARQLEQLHRANGHVTLPYRARLTPLARDWLKAKRVTVGYSDTDFEKVGATTKSNGNVAVVASPEPASATTSDPGAFLWWCDGPCGPAKAALTAQAKESNIKATEIAVDPKRIIDAVKLIAREVAGGRAAGGILLVQNGAAAMVYANRCPSLRAVLATCLDAVDQGVKLVAANVLVVEHPYKTLPQIKNFLSRFVRGRRELSDEVRQQLKELGTCG
ncbi:MAG: RpiB/LacA/LacB family sugar-phosphate isomerase [Tepidisphaeraceae bacterium]